MVNIYDIREDEIKIEGKPWDDPEVQRLAFKQIYIHQKTYEFWEPDLERGKSLFRKYDGRILSDYQRAQYEDVEDKIIVEPPIMKSPIRSLVGHTVRSLQSGQVTTEGGSLDEPYPKAEEITTVNVVLKDFETKTKEKIRFRDAVHDSYVSCYPNVLIYNKKKPSFDNLLKVELEKLAWDSVTVGPSTFSEPDGADIREIFWFKERTQADLEENFPEMKKQIRAHCKSKKVDDSMISNIMQWETGRTSEARDYLSNIIERASNSMDSPAGLIPVIQHVFPIIRKEEVWVNVNDDSGEDYEIRPPDWEDERWDEWVEANKDKYMGPIEREIVTLWQTVFTLTGLVLSNGKHWFQEQGKLPAIFTIPAMISGRVSGPAVDMASDVMRNCVAQIEWLDDIRKGHGILALFREGALKNVQDIPEEANKAFGVGIVSKDFKGGLADAVYEIKREPSDKWLQYGQQAKSDMYENTSLNETMQGAAAPRQAAIAKNIEIAQALTVNAIYIENMNLAWANMQNLKCALIPYVYDEYMVVECYDEEAQKNLVQEVNVPEFDMNGEKTKVVNDLSSRRYAWKINPVDNSPTAKARMMEDALMIINGAAGPLLGKDPTGKMFSRFLQSFNNEYLNKAGKAMAEDAQMAQESQSKMEQQKIQMEGLATMEKAKVDMEKAMKSGVNVSFSAEDLVKYPTAYQYYLQMTGKGQPQPVPPAPVQEPGLPPEMMGATQSPNPEMMGAGQEMMQEQSPQGMQEIAGVQ